MLAFNILDTSRTDPVIEWSLHHRRLQTGRVICIRAIITANKNSLAITNMTRDLMTSRKKWQIFTRY